MDKSKILEKNIKLLNKLYDKLGAEPGIGNILAEIIANEKQIKHSMDKE